MGLLRCRGGKAKEEQGRKGEEEEGREGKKGREGDEEKDEMEGKGVSRTQQVFRGVSLRLAPTLHRLWVRMFNGEFTLMCCSADRGSVEKLSVSL